MSLGSPSQPLPPMERETEAHREEVTGLRSLSKWDRQKQEPGPSQHTPGDNSLLQELPHLSPHLPRCPSLEPACPDDRGGTSR